MALCFSLAHCASTQEKRKADDLAEKQQATAETKLGPYEQYEKHSDTPSVVAKKEPSDPLEGFNRGIFAFNSVLYRFFLTPLAQGYDYIMPGFLSRGVSNFFENLREPLYSLNYLLQLKLEKSANALGRFALNSTVGVLGFFDPADSWLDLRPRSTTLGETFASYGMGHGAYLVLPLLGPSDLLTAPTFALEYTAHPLNLVDDPLLVRGLFVYEGFHDQVPRLKKYHDIVKDKEDPYVFIRNYYIETRMIRFNQLKGEFYSTEGTVEK